jgi:hypothetical protein
LKFTYGDVEYDLVSPGDWTTLEAARIQKASGLKPFELVDDLRESGAIGLHAVVLVTLLRAGLKVTWETVDTSFIKTWESMWGDPIEEPEDPSTASTRKRSASRAKRTVPARSTEN